MKVVFVNPSRGGQGNIPLNIPLVIGILKKYNHKVRLFDMTDYEIFDDDSYDSIFFKEAAFDVEKVIQDRTDFSEKENISRPHIHGCDLKKSDYITDFEILLDDFKPDIVAVSSLSIDFKFICDFLLPFKIRYGFPVIIGGIHAILRPEETINSPACDFICIGEGENSLPMLLDTLENKGSLKQVKGIWFKQNGKITKNSPIQLTELTTLPYPDYDCFDPIHFYRPFDGKRYKMLNYELSRGCPFKCSYCVNGVLQEKYKGLGKYNRIKDINQSIEELKCLINKYKFDFIRFWDEDFATVKTDDLNHYALLYLKEIKLPFLIYARVESVTEKKVQILKKMGCKTFAMGIESGNEFIRKQVMNRKMSNETIIKKFKMVKSYGIRVSAYNIIGLPYETRVNIFDTIKLNRKVKPDSFSVTHLEPYKGTPIRKMCEEQGLDINYEVTQCSIGEPHFIPRDLTHQELKGLFRTFSLYIRFPIERYDEIKLAENDDSVYQKLIKEMTEILHQNKIIDMLFR